jgi:hypothetical protein
MSALGTILNPVGAIAPKKGIGQLLDPVGAVGRKVGGTAGQLIDPAGSFRDPEDFQPKRQAVAVEPTPKSAAEKRRSSLLSG